MALSGLVLLAFAVRVYRLDYQSLWRDEVDAVLFAMRPLSEHLAAFTKVGENGPFFFLGLRAWIELVGHSEFAIRFPSVLFAVLAVLMTYRLGREVVGEEVGTVAALLLAISPYHIWYGQEAKMYALISFLAPLSLLMIVRAVRGGARWLWPAWAVLMAVFLYIHLFAAMMLLVAAAWVPLLLQRRPRLGPGLLAAAGLLLAAVVPVARWLVPAALTPVETGYYPYSLGQMVTILLFSFSMGLRPSAGVWPVVLFGVLLLAGMVPLLLAPDDRGASSSPWPRARAILLLVLYLCIPLLAIWLVSLRRPTFTDRYLIISLPAFYLLMATGLVVARRLVDQVAPRHYRRQAGLAVAAVALVLAVAASLPFVWQQSHNPIKADFRAATRYMTDRLAAQDLVVFLMPYVQRGFAYYHPQPVPAVEPPYTAGMSPAQVDAALRRMTAGSRRVWLFLSEADFWDPAGLIVPWFERNGLQRCRQAFTYIEVRCYDMPGQ